MPGFFFWLGCAFAAGMATHSFPLAAAVVALLVAAAFFREDRRRSLLVLAVVYALGSVYYSLYASWQSSVLSAALGKQREANGRIEGMIASPVSVDGDLVRFTMKVKRAVIERGGSPFAVAADGENVLVRLYLQTADEQRQAKTLSRGDYLIARASLAKPGEKRNPGAFDYARYLANRKIYCVATIESLKEVKVDRARSGHWLAAVDRWRGRLASIISRLYPEDTAGLLRGMILGEREQVPQETLDTYAELGLIHVIAISGLHVALLAGGVLWLLRGLRLTKETAILFTIVVVSFYVLLTGASPSALRAGVMVVFVLAAKYIHRSLSGLDALGIALLLLLFFAPFFLWDIGFQLSFAVTAGLLLFVPTVAERLPWRRRALKNAAAVALVAQAVSFPITIYYFNLFSWLSFFANLVAVPLLSGIVIPLGFLSLLLGVLHESLAVLPSLGVQAVVAGTERFLRFIEEFNRIHLYWARPSIGWIAAYFAVFLVFMRSVKKFPGEKKTFYVSCCFYVALIAYAWNPDLFSRELRITFLDVGQGDATVLEFPNGHVMMIDGGGTMTFSGGKGEWAARKDPFRTGEDLLLPFLKYRGINRIDTLVVTHGDADHINGLIDLIDRVSIGRVIVNGNRPATSLERELYAALNRKKIPVYAARAGVSWNIARDASLLFLRPPGGSRTFLGDGSHDNDASVVFLLQAYGKRFLFAGDLEAEGERDVLGRFSLPPVDVLKVAHHGSKSSTTDRWLDALKPRIAVISAGVNNRYGHPAPEVLERLRRRGSRVYRTDQSGAITLHVRQKGIEAETMR
ncbi:DNA internalization-related competence protein ComEC/Rec2 [Bacillaceae bacterium]